VPATFPCLEPARSSPYQQTYFLKIHLNIILASTPGSPKRTLSLRLPHQNPVYASPIPHTRYIPQPYHSSLFYHPKNTGCGVKIIKLLTMPLLPLPCYLVPLRITYSVQLPILKQLQPTFLPPCEWPSFTPIQKHAELYFCISSSLYFWIANWKRKDSSRNDSNHSVT
jgi:hypothetical protein